MTIGVIGVGKVGGALGARWAEAGRKVIYGVRSPNNAKARALKNRNFENSELAGIAFASAKSEAVVLAVPYHAAEDALAAAGDLSGKVLLDCTDPFSSEGGLKPGYESAAEHVQELAAGARVVKIFNTVGFESMADARYAEGKPTMFYAGDDEEAKRIAHDLAEEVGFEPIDVGTLRQARLLESLASLWVALAEERGLGSNIAFKLLKR